MVSVRAKMCTGCRRVLPLSSYYASRQLANGGVGVQAKCIECFKARKRGLSLEERRQKALLGFPDRFWSYVDKRGPNECWPWVGYTHQQFGYGMISIVTQRPMLLAHRVSLELSGVAIPEGMNVLHRCDNPPCVNPAHLFPGTQADNMRDMQAKGRARGRWSKTRVA